MSACDSHLLTYLRTGQSSGLMECAAVDSWWLRPYRLDAFSAEMDRYIKFSLYFIFENACLKNNKFILHAQFAYILRLESKKCHPKLYISGIYQHLGQNHYTDALMSYRQ